MLWKYLHFAGTGMSKFIRFISRGSLANGKLVLDNPRWFRTCLLKYDDTEKVRVIIEKERGSKTNKQLRYLYGVVYSLICEHTGFTEMELDSAMKSKYLRTKMQWRGGELTIVRDKRNLTSDEMGEFIQRVCEEGAELGVVIPVADKEYRVHEQFPESRG